MLDSHEIEADRIKKILIEQGKAAVTTDQIAAELVAEWVLADPELIAKYAADRRGRAWVFAEKEKIYPPNQQTKSQKPIDDQYLLFASELFERREYLIVPPYNYYTFYLFAALEADRRGVDLSKISYEYQDKGVMFLVVD